MHFKESIKVSLFFYNYYYSEFVNTVLSLRFLKHVMVLTAFVEFVIRTTNF